MKAVFLDRDGVINEEAGYVTSWDQFRFIPGSKEALRLLHSSGYKVFVITNQSGVARGLISESSLLEIHRRMSSEIGEAGGRVTEIYYCGHHPEDGCRCRKPGTGLLERAAAEYGIDLPGAYMIGDKPADIEAGKRAGSKTILVRTGYGMDYQGPEPDFIAADLLEAANMIVNGPFNSSFAPDSEA